MSHLGTEQALPSFKADIEAFAHRELHDYTRRISRNSVPRVPKEFSDPVWATIYLTPFEIVIVDSPIFQRLRRIRQLGVVHWVYPGAVHTRFEHSLGTLHQMQQLIDSINREAQQERRILEDDICFLRVAALCHDLGHGLMSHVSENAIRSFSDVADLTLQFADQHHGLERVRLSEMASFYIVGSPAFRTMIEKAKEATDERKFAIDALNRVQCAIVGDIVANRVPLMQELISGPFDADKLDYMQRDAMMAGVPTVTDVPRLIRKIRAITLPQDSLPDELKSKVKGGEDFYVLFGIAYSGSRTLDELLFGRILLFDKLYRHQKVRAVEGMVSILLLTLAPLFKSPLYLLPYALYDEQLLDIDATLTFNEQFELTGEENLKLFQIACELSRFLRARYLLVRAFAFAKNMPGDPYRNTPEQMIAADKLLRSANVIKKRVLMERIAAETLQILGLLSETKVANQFVDKTLRSYIYIDPPEAPANAGKIPQAYLLGENKRISRFRDASSEMRSWADAYLFAKDIGFVFCLPELKPYVYIASETVVRRDFNLRTPESIFEYIKEDNSTTRGLKERLSVAGYYHGLPHDIRPKASRLLKADIPTILKKTRQRLQSYSGPYTPATEETLAPSYLTNQHLEDWLQQFETEAFITCAVKVLEHLKLVGRKEIVDNLIRFRGQNPGFSNASICPLGDPRDSGPIAAYFSADIPKAKVFDLREALAERTEARHIIFVDDFIGSGHQTVTIVETLLGEPLTHRLSETSRRKLSSEERDKLRESAVCFCYAAGWSKGIDEVKSACGKYGLSAQVAVGLIDNALPTVWDDTFYTDENLKSAFIEKCRAIGHDVLLEAPVGHDEAWVKDKTLGYGDGGLLVAFPYNTPTQSLTCLWKGGIHENVAWLPLLPRRKKR